MKRVLLVLVSLAVVYVGIAVVLSTRAGAKNGVFNANLTRLKDLGEATALTLQVAPPDELVEACKALLEVAEHQVVVYSPMPPAEASDIPYFAKRAIVSRSTSIEWPWTNRDASYFLGTMLTDTPDSWGWRIDKWSEPFSHDFGDAKYLVVHVVGKVRRPRLLDEKTYDAGEMTFHSAVVDVATGKVLCQGTSLVTAHGDVTVRGRGKTNAEAEADALEKRDKDILQQLGFAAAHFVDGELCWLGGESLCKVNYREYAHPQ